MKKRQEKIKEILKRVLCFVLVLAMLIPTILSITANASEKIVTTIKFDDVEYVPITELMNEKNYIVSKTNDDVLGQGLSVIIDDNILNIYDESLFYYLNGELVASQVESVKDKTTGINYDFPVAKYPIKTDYNYDFYVPVKFLNKYFNIELPGAKGYSFIIPDETEISPIQPQENLYSVIPDETVTPIQVVPETEYIQPTETYQTVIMP